MMAPGKPPPGGYQPRRWRLPVLDMTTGARYAVVALFFMCAAVAAISITFSAAQVGSDNRNWHAAVAADDAHWRQAVALGNAHWHQALTSSQRKFCGVVGGVTSVRVPKPAKPRANPSREAAYLLYLKFVKLGRDLGCSPP